MKTFTVWMLAPVNVRVRANNADDAKQRVFDIINENERPEEVDGDDSKAVYFDGSAWAWDTFAKDCVVEHEESDDGASGAVINPEVSK